MKRNIFCSGVKITIEEIIDKKEQIVMKDSFHNRRILRSKKILDEYKGVGRIYKSNNIKETGYSVRCIKN